MTLIQLRDVKKEFAGKSGIIHAVNNVSLSIEQGEIYGIVGYSGAGKSTLVRLLNGLELPTSGEVLVQGLNIGALRPKDLREFRKKIGMIFQHFNLLWSRTILENIMLPLELSTKPQMKKADRIRKAEELLNLVGLQGKGDAYPHQLSGGQKQRVGIARALANDPDILLCDEATSALDPQTTDEVLELLSKINQELGLTIVLITHEMHVIRKICNRVAVMEQGNIVEEGEVLTVFKHPKQEVTKRFVQQELEPEEEVTTLLTELVKENPGGVIVNLQFQGENANEPIISQAIRKFEIDINVVQGKVQQTKEGAFGSLSVMLTGAPEEIEKAMSFFKENEVGLEVLQSNE